MTEQNQQSAEDVRVRVDALLAELTPAEKAGQLTQYFYFGFMREQEGMGDELGLGTADQPSQPELVEAAIARGGVGSLLFLTDPAEINRL